MSPEYLANVSKDLIEIYSNIETQLLVGVAKKVNGNKSLFLDGDINDWQLDRLKELDGLRQDNIDYLVSQTKLTSKEVEDIFDRAVTNGTKGSEAEITKAVSKGALTPVPPFNESITVQRALMIAKENAKTTLNVMNNSMISSAGEVYRKSLNKITTEVLAGVSTRQQALDKALKETARNGLTGFTAKNGAEWSPEAYTSMVIRSDVKNTITEVTNMRIAESGGNYIEINSYAGARPLCSQDQGQIFSLNNDTTPIVDITGSVINVRAWSSSTHGQAAGLFGVNCQHQQFLFVPQISSYDREKIPQKENDALYKESQQQRYLERQIREAKREVEVLKQGASKEEITRAERRVKERQANIREFTKDTDRRRDYSREKVK